MNKNKYYVNMEEYSSIQLAESPLKAALEAFKMAVIETEEEEIQIPEEIHVSEKGFDIHFDDFVVKLETLIGLLMLDAGGDYDIVEDDDEDDWLK
jgi:hypothetical protein